MKNTLFQDALHESMDGLSVIYSTLMSHKPVDLLVIMLGTKELPPSRPAASKCPPGICI